MYQRILAAVNEFTNSEAAARYAIALARSCGASLSLVYVASEKVDREAFGRAEKALERLFVEAGGQDVDVSSFTERGDPFEKIRDIVRKNRIDIVFAATRKEDVEKRFFLRTLGRKFMVSLPCAVSIVRVVRLGKIGPRNILVPIRGHMSRIEERAYFVSKLAEVFGSKVTLFHLIEPITRYFHGEVSLSPSQREERVPKDMARFAQCLHIYKIHHEEKTRYGKSAREITIEAAHRRNDLIVMGASERSILRSFISGNPVETVLRETPCDLIILRPKRS